jgi:lysophospholipase L1-like esterase
MKTVLCYGDSNTWGAIPGTLKRHPKDVRWTGVAANALGAEYELIEDGINGRRTVWDDPHNPCRNGLDSLGYACYRSKPLDMVVIMLGTNDIHHTDAAGSVLGLGRIVHHVINANTFFPGTSPVFKGKPKVLLISPVILFDGGTSERDAYFHQQSCLMAGLVEKMAAEYGIEWMDAAKYAVASPLDGCHMDAESHGRLGLAIAEKIKTML